MKRQLGTNLIKHGCPSPYLESALANKGHPALGAGVCSRCKMDLPHVPSQRLFVLQYFSAKLALVHRPDNNIQRCLAIIFILRSAVAF